MYDNERYTKILDEFPKINKSSYLEFLSEYGNGLTTGTMVNHGYVLKSLAEFTNKPFKEITKEEIAEWLLTLKGKGDNTMRRYKATIKAFYKWLEKSDDYPERVRWIKYKVKRPLPKNVPCELEIYGSYFVVDGKTGQRRIRLIDAVPDLQAWINKHPLKDNTDAPICMLT